MKSHKPLSSKKPPVPGEDHRLIDDWIADCKPSLNPIVAALDKQICRELRQPRYAIKWGKAYYGSSPHGWCIEIAAYAVSANLVFLNGSELSEPPKLGGETRYVKIKSLEDAASAQVSEWIKQSCHKPGWAW